jgi:hypothetical protein
VSLFKFETTDIVFDFKFMNSILDRIPTDIRTKLAAEGFDTLDALPDDDVTMARWDRLQTRCKLTESELGLLMKILVVRPGKYSVALMSQPSQLFNLL